jgi:hypothetical protein
MPTGYTEQRDALTKEATAKKELAGIRQQVASLPARSSCPPGDRTLRPEWMRQAARHRLQTEPAEVNAG